MRKTLGVMIVLAMAVAAQADLVYQDDFASDPIGSTVWNVTAGSPVTYDGPNTQVDYDHIGGTTRKWLSFNSGSNPFLSLEGYMKVTLSNFAGSPDGVWMGFVEDNHSNNGNYISADVVGNGTFELFFNNSAAVVPFDNGGGWSGNLAAGTGLVSSDNGSSTTALAFGAGVTSTVNLKGFGFANFGNAAVFPTASFSVDEIEVHDSVVIPEPATLSLLAMAGLLLIRRKMK